MDPLSALGLASNVVQLVDAATKAVTVCHEIYTKGASIEDSQMAYTSDQLHKSYSALTDSLKRHALTGPKVWRGTVDLEDLGSQCCDTAQKLQTELQSLRKIPAGGVRETTYKFILKQRKSKTIDRLKSRLDEYQKVLDSKVLVDIRHVYRLCIRDWSLIPCIKAGAWHLGIPVRRALFGTPTTALTIARNLDILSNTCFKRTRSRLIQGYQS